MIRRASEKYDTALLEDAMQKEAQKNEASISKGGLWESWSLITSHKKALATNWAENGERNGMECARWIIYQ